MAGPVTMLFPPSLDLTQECSDSGTRRDTEGERIAAPQWEFERLPAVDFV
jgi:hypothetical protein